MSGISQVAVMNDTRRCCKRLSWWSCGVPEDEIVDPAKELASLEVPAKDDITQLLEDIEQTIQNGGNAEREVPMSKQMQTYASHLQQHLNKVTLGAQISRDALNALGTLHWVGAGLIIIAMGLNMTLKTHENKEQCEEIMKESLDIWRKVMKPVLETKGLASDFMGESIDIIIDGYLYCRNLLNSRKWKRFICARCHEKELELWKKKQVEFLVKANAVMNADLINAKRSSAPPTITRTFATTLVGLEGRKRDVMNMLKLEDKEETRIVVLHGMGGVGKSTLADTVYKQASVSKDQKRHCRIELGEKPSKEHITSMQRQMVENLTGGRLNKNDSEEVRDKLCEVLLSETGKPVFIYMDNVYKSEDLEDLLSLDCELMKLPKGSRLLVTTRDKSVCTRIFRRNQGFEVKEFWVQLLNDRDAEKLFFVHAFGQEEPSAEVVERYDDNQGLIKKMVSSICGNLPLALRVLGRSLFNTNVQLWRKKYNDLIKTLGKFEQEEQIRNILKSSYITLNPETQTAFLMACVCFPNSSSYAGFRDVVESLLPKATITRLLELSLLERYRCGAGGNSVSLFIKMHDLVRNMGYEMAVERKCAPANILTCTQDFIDLNSESWSEIKWLRVPPLEDGIDAELLEKCKNLEVILLHTHVNGHIGNPPRQLKVVLTTSSLPLELDKLQEQLVYLRVADPIHEFPVAPSTRKLQVFKDFGGASIPRRAIDFHKNTLRNLRCTQTVELSAYFCVEMTKLQRLSLQDFKGKSFPNDMGRLASLEVLEVSSSTLEELPQSLADLKQLHALDLRLRNLKEIPSGVLGGMKELSFLQLSLERVMYMPMHDIGQLPYLEHLVLKLPSVKRLMDVDGVLLELKELKFFLLKCESMSSLEGDRLSCPSLEYLQLHGFKRLELLPPNFITGSANLRNLLLEGCLALQELSAEMEMLWAVETLAVVECPALQAIPEGLMKSVESLAVVGCPSVGELPADLDEQKAGSMRFLLCDTHLLPPQFLPLPAILPFSTDDQRAAHKLHSFVSESFYYDRIWEWG